MTLSTLLVSFVIYWASTMPKLDLLPTDFVEFYDESIDSWIRGTIISIDRTLLDVALDKQDSLECKKHLTVAVLLEDGDLKNVTWHPVRHCNYYCHARDFKILQRMT